MSLLLALTAAVAPPPVVAGKGGKTLAEYEAEWANSPPQTAQERRRLKREAARKVYLEPFKPELPDVAQAYIDRLKAELDAARTAEIAALLDLRAQTSAVQADIARAAVLMAEKRRADIARQIEEFDVMYVAAILAEA